ncbi:hypothetical protein [Pseudomonas extremaustralis]|nr:hypothetical protein [Pseudomonas extremaustralis]
MLISSHCPGTSKLGIAQLQGVHLAAAHQPQVGEGQGLQLLRIQPCRA